MLKEICDFLAKENALFKLEISGQVLLFPTVALENWLKHYREERAERERAGAPNVKPGERNFDEGVMQCLLMFRDRKEISRQFVTIRKGVRNEEYILVLLTSGLVKEEIKAYIEPLKHSFISSVVLKLTKLGQKALSAKEIPGEIPELTDFFDNIYSPLLGKSRGRNIFHYYTFWYSCHLIDILSRERMSISAAYHQFSKKYLTGSVSWANTLIAAADTFKWIEPSARNFVAHIGTQYVRVNNESIQISLTPVGQYALGKYRAYLQTINEIGLA